MDAPTYPHSAEFEQPTTAPYVLQVENTSLGELVKIPAAWSIVLKHLPSLKMMTGSTMMKPHLGNFAVLTAQTFVKTATPEVLAAINEELATLPPVSGNSP